MLKRTDQELGQELLANNPDALRDMVRDNWKQAKAQVDSNAKDMQDAHYFGGDVVLERAARLAYAIYGHGCWNQLVVSLGFWMNGRTDNSAVVSEVRLHLQNVRRAMPFAKDEHEARALDQHAQECERMVALFGEPA
jgi:hypothetical protein